MLKIYGASDDCIEIEGQMNEEVSCYDVDFKFEFTDGTIVMWHYGKGNLAIWECKLISKGDKLDRIDVCNDEYADIYSDILYMKDSEKCIIKLIEEV